MDTSPRFFMDHGMIHDRVTGQHVHTHNEVEDGATERLFELLTDLSVRSASVASTEIVSGLRMALIEMRDAVACNHPLPSLIKRIEARIERMEREAGIQPAPMVIGLPTGGSVTVAAPSTEAAITGDTHADGSPAHNPIEPFVVKHYGEEPHPCIKGNGFDGLVLGNYREEAEEFVRWINERLSLPNAVVEPPHGWWSFLRSVLSQGASIQQDYVAGTHKGYEEYSARLDAAARERAEEIEAVLSHGKQQP